MNSNFADNLRKIRKENNLSQEQLADKLGVSRQSVSKWESQQAYPEMDKVIQLCNMFNLNIDELLNKDIKQIKEEKEDKKRLNKYLDDFLNFITKTINMFSSMSASQKIKCIFEQIVIILTLVILFFIIGGIGYSLVESLYFLLPRALYSFIVGLLEFIYICIYIGLSIMAIVHVFKSRYLDYYTETKKEVVEEKIVNNDKEEVNLPKREKIIFREPKDSEYGFLNGILKSIIVIIKIMLAFVFMGFACSLVGMVAAFILALIHIFVNPIFIGLTIGFIALIIANTLVLVLLYEFIFNKKIQAKKLFISFLIAIALGGTAVAITFVNSLNLKVIREEYEYKDNINEVYNYNNNFNIKSYDTAEYKFIIDNNMTDKVEIDVNYNDSFEEIKLEKTSDENTIMIRENNILDGNLIYIYKTILDSLKRNEIPVYSYDGFEVVIKTSESNMKNIIKNMTEHKDSDVFIKDGVYYLSIYRTRSNSSCYLKDGYHYSCIDIYGNYDDRDISFDEDGIHYDSSKYDCYKEYGNYYCDRK